MAKETKENVWQTNEDGKATVICNDLSRFETKFTKGDGCWNWTGSCNKQGYGEFGLEGKLQRAHRAAYMFYVGSIPPGLFVLHSCDNRRCVNPAHLWLGTQRENIRDMIDKGRSPNRYGERNGSAKLTGVKVSTIRELVRQSGHTYGSIAHTFGVARSTICDIVYGKTWRHMGTAVE
jgi:hypothetical protein